MQRSEPFDPEGQNILAIFCFVEVTVVGGGLVAESESVKVLEGGETHRKKGKGKKGGKKGKKKSGGTQDEDEEP